LLDEHCVYVVRHGRFVVALNCVRQHVGLPLDEVLLHGIVEPHGYLALCDFDMLGERLVVIGLVEKIGKFAGVQVEAGMAHEVIGFVGVLP